MSLTYQLGEKFHFPFQARFGVVKIDHTGARRGRPSAQSICGEFITSGQKTK